MCINIISERERERDRDTDREREREKRENGSLLSHIICQVFYIDLVAYLLIHN
jgi:hypothetical protein